MEWNHLSFSQDNYFYEERLKRKEIQLDEALKQQEPTCEIESVYSCVLPHKQKPTSGVSILIVSSKSIIKRYMVPQVLRIEFVRWPDRARNTPGREEGPKEIFSENNGYALQKHIVEQNNTIAQLKKELQSTIRSHNCTNILPVLGRFVTLNTCFASEG